MIEFDTIGAQTFAQTMIKKIKQKTRFIIFLHDFG